MKGEPVSKNAGAKERVLLVHNFYQIGGGEHTVFENEKRMLKEHGHDVAEYTRDNAELNHSFLKKLLLPFTTVFSLRTYREIRRMINAKGIDIVHCHNTFPLISPSVYYAARRCGIPVVQTVHNFRFICANGVLSREGRPCEACVKNRLGCALSNRCYRNSWLQTLVLVNMLWIHRMLGTYRKIRYIFLTDFNREKFRPLLGNWLERQFTKPNFEYIDTVSYETARENAYVYIGRLERDKGIDFLLKAWETETERDLYIFGNGVLEDALKEACEKNSRLHWMGFQPKKVVLEYLGKAKGFLFPTDLYEGFPMTIIEAFAMGTPVICSDIGNGAEIVRKHYAGVPYAVRDTDSFWQAVVEVEEHFDEYSRNARTAYLENYTPEKNYLQLKSIYEEVINEQKQGNGDRGADFRGEHGNSRR